MATAGTAETGTPDAGGRPGEGVEDGVTGHRERRRRSGGPSGERNAVSRTTSEAQVPRRERSAAQRQGYGCPYPLRRYQGDGRRRPQSRRRAEPHCRPEDSPQVICRRRQPAPHLRASAQSPGERRIPRQSAGRECTRRECTFRFILTARLHGGTILSPWFGPRLGFPSDRSLGPFLIPLRDPPLCQQPRPRGGASHLAITRRTRGGTRDGRGHRNALSVASE